MCPTVTAKMPSQFSEQGLILLFTGTFNHLQTTKQASLNTDTNCDLVEDHISGILRNFTNHLPVAR